MDKNCCLSCYKLLVVQYVQQKYSDMDVEKKENIDKNKNWK